MHRIVLALAATAALCACAHETPPAAVAGMGWSLSQTDSEGAKLAYGLPQSDTVLLMLACQPRSGQVQVSLTAPVGSPGALEIASQGRRSRLQGQVSPGMGEGAVYVEAEARVDDAALAGFARSGDLTLTEGGRRAALPARGVEQTAVGRFFAACRAA